jgi:hypothetical protein
MIAYRIENEKLFIDSEMKEGEKISGLCCTSFNWEVLLTFPDNNPAYISVWGTCDNPNCPIEVGTHYHTISNRLQEDIALYLLDKEEATRAIQGDPTLS